MIKPGAKRIINKPYLKYPWLVQMQREDGAWVLFKAARTKQAALRILDRLDRRSGARNA